jgi:hypothetical protein
MAKAKRAALYVRVSTDSQTVENQIRELRQVAERRGWEVVGVYNDAGISGAMLPAPRQKLPEISPILKADTVRLHVSGKGQGNCTWSMPDGTMRRSFSRTAAGKLAGAGRADPTPRQGER